MLRHLSCVLLGVVCLLLTGCFEDEAEITINADGSGTFTHTIKVPEQVVYAMDATPKEQKRGPNMDAPFALTEEEMQTKLGDAAKLESFEIIDNPDQSRVIKLSGSFDNVAVFLNSDYASDPLKLSIEQVDGKARIAWNVDMNSGGMGPNIDQMYGLAKGLKSTRIIHAPADVTADLGAKGKTVTWTVDLSSRDSLAKTKEKLEKANEGYWTATFDAGGIELPEANVATVDAVEIAANEAGGDGKVEASAEATGLKAEVTSVKWTKVARVSAAHPAGPSTLQVDVLLTWPKGKRPESYFAPQLTSLNDDQGNALVPDGPQGNPDWRQQIWEHNEDQTITLEAKTPDSDAKSLSELEGSVKVVAARALKTVTLKDPKALVGKATGDADLAKIGLKISKISDTGIEMKLKDGVDFKNVIKSITATMPDDTIVQNNGWGGWNNQVTYNFPQDVSGAKSIDIELVTGETIVEVPFSVETVKLP